MDNEENLVVKMEKSATRLKAATGYMVAAAEPMQVIQTHAYMIHLLRAEMTALRDMMKGKVLDTGEYQKRTKDYMDEYVSLIERSVGIQVAEDGKFVMITPRAEANKGGKA